MITEFTDMETLVNIVMGPRKECDYVRVEARVLIFLSLNEMNGSGWSRLPVHTRKDLIKIVAGPLANISIEAAHA